MCNMGGSCNPKSKSEKVKQDRCSNCKYIRFNESVLEMVCALDVVLGTGEKVKALPSKRICSNYERKP